MLTVGTEAPDFTLPDQNGEMHSLSDYRGQKVILSEGHDGGLYEAGMRVW